MRVSVWGRGRGSKLLARALGVRRNRPATVVVRWKMNNPTRIVPEVELNTTQAIRNSSNKLKSLQIMKEAGLTVPPFAVNLSDLNPKVGDIIFGRFRYHTQGDDIVVMRKAENGSEYFLPKTDEAVAKEQFLTKEYFIKWMPSRSEYRYHVAFGKVILCTKKKRADPDDDRKYFIRNHQGGRWKQVVCEETPRFTEACLKAMKAHGLDFGAVDFLNVKGEPVMLEINTAAGLQVANRLTAYSEAIKEKLRTLR